MQVERFTGRLSQFQKVSAAAAAGAGAGAGAAVAVAAAAVVAVAAARVKRNMTVCGEAHIIPCLFE